MEREKYEELARMQIQLNMEYESVSERLQGILNYCNFKVPGNVRLAALRRAKNMREFLDQLIAELEGQ